MSIDSYINSNFTAPQKIFFFLLALIGIILSISLIVTAIRLSNFISRKESDLSSQALNGVQKFYEMIISGSSVMSFSCAYVICNHIYSLSSGYSDMRFFTEAWSNWKDFILLLMICLSCVINTILDKLIIPLKAIDKDEKASIRLLAMFYVIIILVCLNKIGDESEYNPVMMYYLGLMIGRFVYFDASFGDFFNAIKSALKNILLLLLGLFLTIGLSIFGFEAGFLLERNYYIVGVFYTNLFMLAAVFLIHHSHILNLIFRKKTADRG